jgi:hypothetical protein
MFQAALDQEAVHDLQATLSGRLLSRHDEDYENARKVWPWPCAAGAIASPGIAPPMADC